MRTKCLWAALLLVFAAFLAACGPPRPSQSPTDAVKLIARLVETQTYGMLWDSHVSLDRRKRLDRGSRRTLEKSEKYKALLDMGSKDLFVATFPIVAGADNSFAFQAIVAERIDGQRAAVSVSYADGSVREFQLVAEESAWKLDAIQGSEALGPVLTGAESVDGYSLR